jgi:hypothetical protein
VCSLNERGLFDYLLLNDELEATVAELSRIAQRAIAGLPAEPGQVPDEVRFEEEGEESAAAAAGADTDLGIGGSGSTSNAAAAAAAGMQAAEALPTVGSGALSTVPRGTQQGSPPAAAARTSPSAQQQRQQSLPAQPSPRHLQQQQQELEQLQEQEQLAGPSGAAAAADVAAGLDAWRGKVALVTGASSGIGWAVCEALGRAGLRVVAVARRRERLQELQQQVLSPAVGMAPSDFLPVVCDVTKEAEVSALPKIIVKHW